MRTKLRRMRRNKVSGKNSKMFKMPAELREQWRSGSKPASIVMELGDDCCHEHFNTAALSRASSGGGNSGDRFLVMGAYRNGQMTPTLVLPWTKKSKVTNHVSALRDLTLQFDVIFCFVFFFRRFVVP